MSQSAVGSLLEGLEAALKHHGLWQSEPPSASALASAAPFHCDTLSFEQWLQFVFLPRFRAVLQAGQDLPGPMALAPMAEHVWGARPELSGLLALIASLDGSVNASR